MGYLFLKAALTGAMVVAISEISKRSSVFAALLASLPLTSILAFVWMYIDGKSVEAIRELSLGIFWMVLPSLAFFHLLPLFLKTGFRFYPALGLACFCMGGIYFVYAKGIAALGVRI